MSGYRDGQGRYRKIAPGRKVAGFFLTCERCGYLGAPHDPLTCERNEEYDRRRVVLEPVEAEPSNPTATTEEEP